jgi:hypothetical protein
VPPLWPVSGNRGSARPLLYVLWVGFHCEPLRNATRAAPRGRCAWKTMVTGENHIEISVSATAARSRSARHGEQLDCNRAEPMPELAR